MIQTVIHADKVCPANKTAASFTLIFGKQGCTNTAGKAGTFVLVNKPGPWQHNAPQQSSFASPKLV